MSSTEGDYCSATDDEEALVLGLEEAINTISSRKRQMDPVFNKTKYMEDNLNCKGEFFHSADETDGLRPRIVCDRPATRKDEFDANYLLSEQQQNGMYDALKNGLTSCCKCSTERVKKIVHSNIPVFEWLPKYKWRRDLVWDAISGCTVAVMQIPQGLGYAMLGNVPPIVGIYMAFFPVLIYFFFGTSRHISLGTLSVVTLMCGRIVTTYAVDHHDLLHSANDSNTTAGNITLAEEGLTPIQVAMAISFLVGIWQLVMHVLQLGVLGLLLSESLVSGFTTAAAVQVLTSQIKNLLGIRLPKFSGKFALVYTVEAIFKNIGNTNIAALVTSLVTMSFLVFHSEVLKPIYSKRTKVPVPIELIVLVLGTIISKYVGLKEDYGMRIVDTIPTGIPAPTIPPLYILRYILMDTLSIAIVAYAISLSMAKIFARKHKYYVDPNQELLAQGLANVGGSFFSSMPVAASLSRSLIQESVGGKTQIASVVSCLLLLLVLLFVGPFFEPLPLAVLASIIAVALKGMFVQVGDFFKALKTCPCDAFVWGAAFLGTVLIDIDLGLVVGVASCLCCLVYQGLKPHACLLGNVPGTELYLNTKKYKSVVEDPEIKIFHWSGGIHFANYEAYVEEINRMVSIPDIPKSPFYQTVTPMAENVDKNKSKNLPLSEAENGTVSRLADEDAAVEDRFIDDLDQELAMSVLTYASSDVPMMRFIVLDLSSISFIDLAGSKCISVLITDFKEKGVTVLIVCPSGNVLRRLEDCNSLKSFSRSCLFSTVADAVAVAQAGLVPNSTQFLVS